MWFSLGLLSLRKFTSPTSQRETSTETMWTVCGGSGTLSSPRQVISECKDDTIDTELKECPKITHNLIKWQNAHKK